MRTESKCPRCNRITNHNLELREDDTVIDYCGNCNLERHGHIQWDGYYEQMTSFKEWKEREQ